MTRMTSRSVSSNVTVIVTGQPPTTRSRLNRTSVTLGTPGPGGSTRSGVVQAANAGIRRAKVRRSGKQSTRSPVRRLVPGASGRANGRFLARPTSLGAPVLQVQRWNHDHVQGRRGDDAAEDDDRHGLLDLLARLAGAERERNEADAGDERRHKDRAEALYRSLDDGVAEPDAFLLYEVAVVADEHDAVAGGNAEECDEPDEGGDRQRPAGDEHHDH